MQQTNYEIATEISKRVKNYLETMTDFDDWELYVKDRFCGAVELIVVEELQQAYRNMAAAKAAHERDLEELREQLRK